MNKAKLHSHDTDETIDLTAIEDDLRPQSTEKLRFRFFECYNGAARFIAEAAVCVRLLKERGENLAGVPMVGIFLRVASGQILPELVWKFIDSPNRQLVERLPLDNQKRLVANPMIPVVEASPDGKTTTRMVDMTTAPRAVANLGIGPDGIRQPEEQLAHLAVHKARPPAREPEKDSTPDEPLRHGRTVRMTDSEIEAVKIHAALAKATEGEMLRRFLRRGGAFERPKV